MADITFYHCPGTRSDGTLWLLEELSVNYDTEVVNVFTGEGSSAEHKARNVLGKIPVIEYKGQFISELAAISIFLCDLYPDAGLAPKFDDPLRGDYLKWSVYRPGVLEPSMISKHKGWEIEPGMMGWRGMDEVVEQLADHLKDRKWFLGDQFSGADTLTGGGIGWMRAFGFIDEHEVFDRYIGQIREREAFKRVTDINEKLKAEMDS